MSRELRTPLHPALVSPCRVKRRRRDGSELGRVVPRSPCGSPWLTTGDATHRFLLSKTTTSTRVSFASLLRPRAACTTHAVPGEPGVSRHPGSPEWITLAFRGRHFLLCSSSSVTDLRAPLSRPPFECPASARRAEVHARVGGRPRGERRDRFHRLPVKADDFSRPGTPSLDEHPSRVFFRGRDFAVTSRFHAVPFPPHREAQR